MKSKNFYNCFKNFQFLESHVKPKTIKWELVYVVIMASIWSSCNILSPNQSSANLGVYMWSSTFESADNESLVSFLENEDLNSVFLSVGFEDPQLDKAEKFVQMAREKEIEVHVLFGGNEIVTGVESDQLVKMVQISEIAKKIGVDQVHLDVEPHVFEDWKENRSVYENSYLDMLKNAEKIFSQESISLSVSIPHFYDSINSEIENYVDEAVVMVYETTDINTIKSRTKEESAIFEEKMSVAIRPEDYTNFETLDRIILEIVMSGTARKVYLHDAGALLNT